MKKGKERKGNEPAILGEGMNSINHPILSNPIPNTINPHKNASAVAMTGAEYAAPASVS